MSRTCEITTLNNVIKVSPNILTLTDAASRGQKVGDSDFAAFFHSVSRRPIHCSALTAVNTRKLLRAQTGLHCTLLDGAAFEYWKLLRGCWETTPALCASAQCLLAILCTTKLNYSRLAATTPRFFILSQRALAQKWSSFPAKSKHIIL